MISESETERKIDRMTERKEIECQRERRQNDRSKEDRMTERKEIECQRERRQNDKEKGWQRERKKI